MIITEDEYGFVSYQDFKAYANKVFDAIEEYSPFDDCENYALVINGDTLDFEVRLISEIEINEDTYPLKDLVRDTEGETGLEVDFEAVDDVVGKYLFVH